MEPHGRAAVLWTFSICLESVAIVPQLYMLTKCGIVENLTSHYMALCGLYRVLYMCNWYYRMAVYDHATPLIVWASGIVQIVLYADFFYHYCKSKCRAGLSSDVDIDDPV